MKMRVAVLSLLLLASVTQARPQFGLGLGRFSTGGFRPTQNVGPGAFGQQNNVNGGGGRNKEIW